MGILSKTIKKAGAKVLKKIADADNVKPKAGTGFKFSNKTTSEITAGATNSRTAGDDAVAKGMEAGRTRTGNTSSGPTGGTITEGTLSYPRMQESATLGSRARANKVAKLEIKKANGTITADEREALKMLNKASKLAAESAALKGAATQSVAKRGKGVTLAGPNGSTYNVGAKAEKVSDMIIGNRTNGINSNTGEVYGNPTNAQVQTAIRNADAKAKLSIQAAISAKKKRPVPSKAENIARRKANTAKYYGKKK